MRVQPNSPTIDTVVFDIGGVLVDWNPRYLYRTLLPDQPEFMEWFLTNVCTSEWNETQDGGRSLAEGTRLLCDAFPEYEFLIRQFYDRHAEMFSGAFADSVKALLSLREAGYPVFGLTNWAAELFPAALERFSFLTALNGVLVSGVEKLKKPDPKIFQLLCDRYQIDPRHSLFIDDRLSNVEAASTLGFQVLHFVAPGDLSSLLRARGLKIKTSI